MKGIRGKEEKRNGDGGRLRGKPICEGEEKNHEGERDNVKEIRRRTSGDTSQE